MDGDGLKENASIVSECSSVDVFDGSKVSKSGGSKKAEQDKTKKVFIVVNVLTLGSGSLFEECPLTDFTRCISKIFQFFLEKLGSSEPDHDTI